MKNFLKTITNKVFLNALALYISMVALVILSGGLYLIFGAWLVSEIFNTVFTVLQFAQVNVLAWMATGVYKLWNGIKIRK